MIKASCTWGEGPDVMLIFEDKPFILYEDPIGKERWVHGVVNKGSTDLTADEAENLANQLKEAVRLSREFEAGLVYEREKEEGEKQ